MRGGLFLMSEVPQAEEADAMEVEEEEDDEEEEGDLGSQRLVPSSLLYYSRAWIRVIQKSMSLQYEPCSEPLHISVKQLLSNRELYRSGVVMTLWKSRSLVPS